MDTKSWICVGVCVAVSITVIMLLVSMDSIEPLNYGITYNKITKSIGTEIYESGRYLIGPVKGFLEYPSNLQTIEFSDSKSATSEPMLTRTSEGLSLTLFVSFQFQIMKNEIPKLYNLANTNYFGTYVRISRDIILKIASMYNATSYWTNRTDIGDHMLRELNSELQKAYAKCISLQILKVDLPTTYEDSIVQTQVEVQKTNMRKFEQQAELIRQNISVIRSEADQQIRITNSTANAEAFRIKQFANAKAINNTINAEAEIFKDFSTKVGLNPQELNQYLFLDGITNKKDAKVLVGLSNSIINLGGNTANPISPPSPK